MVADSIIYDTSFFQRVFSYPVYKTKNVVALTDCLKQLESEKNVWTNQEGKKVSNDESDIKNVATNYLAMTFILNRLNNILLFQQKKGVLEVSTEAGETSTEQLDFMSNQPTNQSSFVIEFDRFHQLLNYYKELILTPGSHIYNEITAILSKTIPVHNESNLFIKHIQEFFPKAIDVAASQTFGFDDNGLDVDFTYRANRFKAKVVSCNKLEKDGDFYKIWTNFHSEFDGNVAYIIFILPNNYVYVFNNDKTKMRNMSRDTIHHRTASAGLSYLFHKDILMNYKKLF